VRKQDGEKNGGFTLSLNSTSRIQLLFAKHRLMGTTCWVHAAPRPTSFRNAAGFSFTFHSP
jgi:hypothetical protein